jgi:hypothetical protein
MGVLRSHLARSILVCWGTGLPALQVIAGRLGNGLVYVVIDLTMNLDNVAFLNEQCVRCVLERVHPV